MSSRWHRGMRWKCVACKGTFVEPPHREFFSKRTATNRFAGMRKPVRWCRPCWERAEVLNEAYRRKVEEKVERAYRAALAKLGGAHA